MWGFFPDGGAPLLQLRNGYWQILWMRVLGSGSGLSVNFAFLRWQGMKRSNSHASDSKILTIQLYKNNLKVPIKNSGWEQYSLELWVDS